MTLFLYLYIYIGFKGVCMWSFIYWVWIFMLALGELVVFVMLVQLCNYFIIADKCFSQVYCLSCASSIQLRSLQSLELLDLGEMCRFKYRVHLCSLGWDCRYQMCCIYFIFGHKNAKGEDCWVSLYITAIFMIQNTMLSFVSVSINIRLF